jgi:hypothetical protein
MDVETVDMATIFVTCSMGSVQSSFLVWVGRPTIATAMVQSAAVSLAFGNKRDPMRNTKVMKATTKRGISTYNIAGPAVSSCGGTGWDAMSIGNSTSRYQRESECWVARGEGVYLDGISGPFIRSDDVPVSFRLPSGIIIFCAVEHHSLHERDIVAWAVLGTAIS